MSCSGVKGSCHEKLNDRMAWSAMSDPLTMDTLINCSVLVKEKQLVNNNRPNRKISEWPLIIFLFFIQGKLGCQGLSVSPTGLIIKPPPPVWTASAVIGQVASRLLWLWFSVGCGMLCPVYNLGHESLFCYISVVTKYFRPIDFHTIFDTLRQQPLDTLP